MFSLLKPEPYFQFLSLGLPIVPFRVGWWWWGGEGKKGLVAWCARAVRSGPRAEFLEWAIWVLQISGKNIRLGFVCMYVCGLNQ